MNTKNLRKEAVIGLLLLGVYLVLRIFPRDGFIMGLLLGAGVLLVVVGLLPDSSYQKVKQLKEKLFKRN